MAKKGRSYYRYKKWKTKHKSKGSELGLGRLALGVDAAMKFGLIPAVFDLYSNPNQAGVQQAANRVQTGMRASNVVDLGIKGVMMSIASKIMGKNNTIAKFGRFKLKVI